MQILYIEEALDKVLKSQWTAFKIICSPEFSSFLSHTPKENLLEMNATMKLQS